MESNIRKSTRAIRKFLQTKDVDINVTKLHSALYKYAESNGMIMDGMLVCNPALQELLLGMICIPVKRLLDVLHDILDGVFLDMENGEHLHIIEYLRESSRKDRNIGQVISETVFKFTTEDEEYLDADNLPICDFFDLEPEVDMELAYIFYRPGARHRFEYNTPSPTLCRVSESMGAFLGISPPEEVERTKVTWKIMDYIISNDLFLPGTKRYIIPDAALESVVGTAEERENRMKKSGYLPQKDVPLSQLSVFNLSLHLNRHFFKCGKKYEPSWKRNEMLYQIRQWYDTPPLKDALPVFRKGGEGFYQTAAQIEQMLAP